jgi:hypothetical protein
MPARGYNCGMGTLENTLIPIASAVLAANCLVFIVLYWLLVTG